MLLSRTTLAAGTLAFAALSGGAALASDSVTIYPENAVPEYSEDCPENATLRLIPDAASPKIELYLPNFVAVATAANTYVTRNCNVWIKLKAPENYQIAPHTLKFEGKATITSAGDGDITARYYLSATDSVVGYRSFAAGYNGPFTVDTTEGTPAATVCGGVAEFNFMADLTAAFDGVGGRSEVKVQRGSASVAVPTDTPVFQVGLKLIRCF